MTDPRADERIGELLADLDRALAVEPSPAVAARVRTRMEASTFAWLGWRWSIAAASGIVLSAVAYFAWPQPTVGPSVPVQVVVTALPTPAAEPLPRVPSPAAAPLPTPAERMVRAESAEPGGARRASSDVREPEVLVSPSQRIALEQLAAALRDGRLTTEAVAAANQPSAPEPLIVPSMVIAPFQADVLPAIGTSVTVGTGGGVVRRFARVVAAEELADR